MILPSSIHIIPSLPDYHGPYHVGSTEHEIPVSEIASPSPVPDPEITTIKFRIFYPTKTAYSFRNAVSWLPSPQSAWVEAYSKFMGAGPRLAKLVSLSPNHLRLTIIPATANAPLLRRSDGTPYPVFFFSHGLGGNCNAYSAILGNLASCGVVCVAPEHRDGSCPVSLIRAPNGSDQSDVTIPYKSIGRAGSAEELRARNAQLRIRLWENELIYSVITSMNHGDRFTNLSTSPSNKLDLKDAIDLQPGSVTWAGHSFGAASSLQFVKSVFYHQKLPSPNGTRSNHEPLYSPAANSDLVTQITPASPIVLLDLWTTPLDTPSTRWLYSLPLPYYSQTSPPPSSCPVLSIMSAEFYRWTETLTRTRRILAPPTSKSKGNSKVNIPTPRIFYVPGSAHISQSDFGLLFPRLTRYLLKCEQPERTTQLNVRAILQVFRIKGMDVESVVEKEGMGKGETWDGEILETRTEKGGSGGVEGWIGVPLSAADEVAVAA